MKGRSKDEGTLKWKSKIKTKKLHTLSVPELEPEPYHFAAIRTEP
jgi:hypothetical protein